jgi:hypothetical protein
MHRLVNAIPQLAARYPTKCSRGGDNDTYKTVLIHKEYGHNGVDEPELDRPGERSDVVIFSSADAKRIIDPINLKVEPSPEQDKGYLTPAWIFEFGTEKSGTVSVKKLRVVEEIDSDEDMKKACQETRFWKHLKQDYDKVSRAGNRGYVINIFRNYSRARRKDNRRKVEFCEKVARSFVQANSTNNHVRFVLLVVDLGSDNGQAQCSVRLLTKHNGEYNFYTVSQGRLHNDIRNHLREWIPKLKQSRRYGQVIRKWDAPPPEFVSPLV